MEQVEEERLENVVGMVAEYDGVAALLPAAASPALSPVSAIHRLHSLPESCPQPEAVLTHLRPMSHGGRQTIAAAGRIS